MSPLTCFLADNELGVPRASGDEPPWIEMDLQDKMCSPRERG